VQSINITVYSMTPLSPCKGRHINFLYDDDDDDDACRVDSTRMTRRCHPWPRPKSSVRPHANSKPRPMVNSATTT